MKSPEDVMEILEAYDLTGSLRGAAALAGCEDSYVKPPPCEMVARGRRSPSRMPLRGSLRSALSGHPLTARSRARLCSEEGLGRV